MWTIENVDKKEPIEILEQVLKELLLSEDEKVPELLLNRYIEENYSQMNFMSEKIKTLFKHNIIGDYYFYVIKKGVVLVYKIEITKNGVFISKNDGKEDNIYNYILGGLFI